VRRKIVWRGKGRLLIDPAKLKVKQLTEVIDHPSGRVRLLGSFQCSQRILGFRRERELLSQVSQSEPFPCYFLGVLGHGAPPLVLGNEPARRSNRRTGSLIL
jgi:hypothetical protein